MLPPLVSFKSAVDLKKAILATGELSQAEEKAFSDLVHAGLPPLVSPTAFGLILGISPKLITSLATHPRRKYPYYRRYKVPKKSGGSRTILAPRTYLKAVQKFILRQILEKHKIPEYVTGFVKRTGIIQNARFHVGAQYLLNVDIKDFFPSVRMEKVLKIFREFGFSREMSRLLTMLCTFEGSLPQGAPSSPSLANLVFLEIDNEIVRICRRFGMTYSRYADDLTFSRRLPIPENFLTRLTALLGARGFTINRKKIRNAKSGQAMYVTGLVVNEKVQPDRQTRRMLRAMFHGAVTQPRVYRKRAAQLSGWASYVFSYDRSLGSRYLKIARSLATG